MTAVLDLTLTVTLLAVAAMIATVRDDRDAIVGFIALGLLLGPIWARLAALDVALTEVAIGGGATGLLLLRAEASLRVASPRAVGTSISSRFFAMVGCAALSAGLAYVVLTLPSPAPSLASTAASQLQATGVGNPVTAVLLAFRALDTLLEKVVLLVAVFGIWSLAPDGAWCGSCNLRPASVPEPVTYLARVLPPIGIVIGVYMFWLGADAPGGTFQAGTVLAAMWVLTMIAGITPPPDIADARLRLALVFGPVVFFAVGLAGFPVSGAFLSYPPGLAKPLILAIEAALTISVAATLAMLVGGLVRGAPRS